MGVEKVEAGTAVPDDVNVIIEIPMNGPPIKYEVDKDSGMLWVDRFMSTAMHYPCNYGYIPQTLSGDGDPVDVLVVTPIPLQHGVVIRVRPVGMLRMTDEAGEDTKLLAVPVSKLTQIYDNVHSPDDLPPILLDQIKHFFEHYKDLEKGKWVRVEGWVNREAAWSEIISGIKNYKLKK
ncbi:MAG TPA: inorganic diphosphatase [Burkholderiales bacterium]|nr:inorganic diphosphatase [Pseudomonadota bacterium]HVC48802.1 inorganic diphosphatase [Burkholderiales bacterium]